MAGGSLNVGGDMTLGDSGGGTVLVELGGHLAVKGGIELGANKGATGKLTLDGNGSQIQSHEITVGAAGPGAIKVSNAATLLTTGDATIADQAIANVQSVALDTLAVWSIAGDLTVGSSGVAKAAVQGGARLSDNGNVTLAEAQGASATLTVSGSHENGATLINSTLHWGGALTVAEKGVGTPTVQAGAQVTAIGAGAFEIGAMIGSKGAANIDGKGSVLTADSLAVGGTAELAGGEGRLTVSSAAVATFKAATVWKSGGVALNGGTLHVTGQAEGPGGITIGAAGTLILGGHVETVGVSFAAASQGALLSLADAGALDSAIRGFARGDRITLGGLDAHATFAVKASGANTIVTITDDGKQAGILTLLGHYAGAALHLSQAGVMTTTAPSSAAID
jgi:T5SS/PEP-CTERM-associated repeat protein